MITILALIAGLFIGLLLGLWACMVGLEEGWIKWNKDEKDEVD